MKTDARIQQDVMEQIKSNPLLNAAQIGVAVKNGVVTLAGQVNTFLEKTEAEKEAKKVAGVKAIAEDLQVDLSPLHQKSDPEIARAALLALRWDTSIPEDRIRVQVEAGQVTLEGEVAWGFQREAAKKAVGRLVGVRGVTNKITIKPQAEAVELKKRIHAAFRRMATIDAGRIQVAVQGPKVILSGEVGSFAEKEEAEHTVWSAPGILEVENRLEVAPRSEEAPPPSF